MDMVSFGSLGESCQRIDAAQRVEDTWSNFVSAQGDNKNVKDWLRRWQEIANADAEPANDMDDFLTKYGKGI